MSCHDACNWSWRGCGPRGRAGTQSFHLRPPWTMSVKWWTVWGILKSTWWKWIKALGLLKGTPAVLSIIVRINDRWQISPAPLIPPTRTHILRWDWWVRVDTGWTKCQISASHLLYDGGSSPRPQRHGPICNIHTDVSFPLHILFICLTAQLRLLYISLLLWGLMFGGSPCLKELLTLKLYCWGCCGIKSEFWTYETRI